MSGAAHDDLRAPAVAGTFYPAEPDRLERMVQRLFVDAALLAGVRTDAVAVPRLPSAILVPHAGLVYSGEVAAAGWGTLAAGRGGPPSTVVLLGTNHVAGWLRGVAAWEAGRWPLPDGGVDVDVELAAAIVALGGAFGVDRAAHRGEHSIEVQLPLLAAVAPGARIVPLAVAAGTGRGALEAGEALGRLLATRRAAGERVVLAISTDMAHYPPAVVARQVTAEHLAAIEACDPAAVAATEERLRDGGIRGLDCGMCGIEPAVLGVAAARAMGATRVSVLASATSADAGGAPNRTVGYLSCRFDVPSALGAPGASGAPGAAMAR